MSVFRGKTLGVLDREKYKMTYFVELKTITFDGWDYYEQGIHNVNGEDRYFLEIE
jgi:hypothetical protein